MRRGMSGRLLFVVIFLLLAFLVANRALVSHGSGNCLQDASSVKQKSLSEGFSEAGSRSQAENFIARCLINGR
ncbi:hypothetical protein OVY01_01535 [Robbsia sp. Bb-Pol-6]|uniref:Uncharacterized protein n=1 Tax=Robbsia betulipollinis TaxID=2981849 RepID=A0ABT3ZHE7_9BURK|nr:hypothetical protein [Robbsia betulipollinis]MCY0385944.1 hypothetical protein [Robbsia betulipollinis]